MLEISDRFGNFVRDIVNLTRLVSIIFPAGLSSSVLIFLTSVFCSGAGVGAAGVFCAHYQFCDFFLFPFDSKIQFVMFSATSLKIIV